MKHPTLLTENGELPSMSVIGRQTVIVLSIGVVIVVSGTKGGSFTGITLITSVAVSHNPPPSQTTTQTPETNLDLLKTCLKKTTMKEIATKLNVCMATINRWIELKDVPIQYPFD